MHTIRVMLAMSDARLMNDECAICNVSCMYHLNWQSGKGVETMQFNWIWNLKSWQKTFAHRELVQTVIFAKYSVLITYYEYIIYTTSTATLDFWKELLFWRIRTYILTAECTRMAKTCILGIIWKCCHSVSPRLLQLRNFVIFGPTIKMSRWLLVQSVSSSYSSPPSYACTYLYVRARACKNFLKHFHR